MSDDLTPAEEEADDTSSSLEITGKPTDVSEDDIGGLKRALEHEREERRQAKEELRRIREDEEARAELLQEWGYEIDEDPEEEAEDDDPVRPLDERLTKAEQWQAAQEAKEADRQIRTDLDAINEDSDWELDDEDRQWIVNKAAQNPKGFDRTALEQAHKAYIDRLEARASKAVERAKTPKKASARVPAGKPATGVKDVSEMSRQEHIDFMVQRARALAQE